MMEMLFRLQAELGPAATWTAVFFTVVVAVFVLYIGVAMRAILRASDPEQARIRYRVFQDLLGLFRFRRRR
jgi:hypothetical protein